MRVSVFYLLLVEWAVSPRRTWFCQAIKFQQEPKYQPSSPMSWKMKSTLRMRMSSYQRGGWEDVHSSIQPIPLPLFPLDMELGCALVDALQNLKFRFWPLKLSGESRIRISVVFCKCSTYTLIWKKYSSLDILNIFAFLYINLINDKCTLYTIQYA